MPPPHRSRAGVAATDVVVGLFLAGVVAMFLLMGATRARESARLLQCQRNLAQIGQALAHYEEQSHGLPAVGFPIGLDSPPADAPPGPLRTMLEALDVPDFLGVGFQGPDPGGPRGRAAASVPVPGFLCPADVHATAGRFPSPVSYRASVGSTPAGDDGAFAPGRRLTLGDVERRDGLSFTSAFSERLVGDGAARLARWNYRRVPAPAGATPGEGAWSGDAGSTWGPADYRYTLYTHAAVPNAPESWVAADGRSSTMGASSAHVQGLNLLMMDGSARVVTPSIAPQVWAANGSVGPEPAPADAPSPSLPPRN